MNDVNWQSQYQEWMDQVRIFLREIAQVYLSDTPRLPEALSQKIVPLSQTAQHIRKRYEDEYGKLPLDNSDLLWVDRVYQFLRELSGVYLSDRPFLPEDLSHKALDLAKEAKRIQEQSHHSEFGSTGSSTRQLPLPADGMIDELQKKIKLQWANSTNSNAPEWQQLMAILDVAKKLYDQLTVDSR